MIKSWGFIFVAQGANPATDRMILERDGVRTVLVGVPDPSLAPRIATELVDGGAQLIELCGVFGPVWTAKVIEATDKRVPVGVVGFGAESLVPLANLVTAA